MTAPLVRLLHCDPSATIPTPDAKYRKPSQSNKASRAKKAEASGPRHVVKASDKVATVPQSTIDKLKKLRDPERKSAFDAIFAGESFAEAGSRDTALQRVCSSLCWADEGKTTIEGLIEFLRPSLTVWEDEGHEDIWDSATEKLERAAGDFSEFKGKQLEGLEGLRKALTEGTDPSFKQLALQQDNTFYVYSFQEEQYWPSCTTRELLVVLRDAWPEGGPATLTYLTAKGEVKKKTTAQIMDEYGTVVREVIYSMSKTSALYSPDTRVLRVPSASRRPLTPTYYPEIEKWLSLMPKYKKHVPMLLDWIATSMLLDRMSAVLYLSGVKGTGKSLLSTGLARLWARGGPSKLEHVFTRFNDVMLKCPLFVLDESWKGDQNINLCAQLRELIGNMNHQVEPKGKPVVTVEGAVRVMVTANNETTLNVRGNGDQNQMEREATVERVLHIPTSPRASKYIVTIKDRDDWREKNMIAEHALWLRDERAAGIIERARNEGHRFLIQGDPSDAEFYDGIGSRPKDHDAALQWLSLLFTRKALPAIREKILIEPGKFRVVPRALCESWESYGLSKNFDAPTSSHRAKGILKPFLESDDRVKLNGANAYRINIERFVRIVKEEGLIPAETLAKKLGV